MDSEFVIDKILHIRVGYIRCSNCGSCNPDKNFIEICHSCGAVHKIDFIDYEKLTCNEACGERPYISVEQTENGQVLIARIIDERF